MREVVPAATINARTTAEYGSREFVISTSLPEQLPALHREDGTVILALQTLAGSGDLSRDLAANLLDAFELEPGLPLTRSELPGPGPRLQDVLDLTAPFEVVVHDNFDYWIDPNAEINAELRGALDEAADSMIDTVKLTTVDSAYWCRMGPKEFLRWSMPYDEDAVINGIARLHAKRASGITPEAKYVGSFRAEGLSIPVWDLPQGYGVEGLEGHVDEFRERFEQALANTEPLSILERRARGGIVARQVTLR
jgi:hypothetical protein